MAAGRASGGKPGKGSGGKPGSGTGSAGRVIAGTARGRPLVSPGAAAGAA